MSQVAVEEAVRLGASFSDVRLELHQREQIVVQNGVLKQATLTTDRGMGLRVLVNGAWGFAAVGQPTRHDALVLAKRAVEIARAAAVVQPEPVRLVPEPAHCSVYRTAIERDPLGVPIEDKLALLLEIDGRLRKKDLIKLALSTFSAHRVRKLYVSSQGAEIDQDLVCTGIGYQAGASDGDDFQIRSYPDSAGGRFFGRGWEAVESLPLVERAEETAEEAIELLKADPCPYGETSLILGSSQLALQIHESCGHAVELDRVLGHERNFAGASFLTPDRLGSFQYGSKHVNIFADSTIPGAPGTFGFDDEGVEAQRIDLITEGRFTGYLSSRDSAKRVGLRRSFGALRSSSWATVPIIRMTNVCLKPGDAGTLDDLIANTESGVLMDTNRSWSIDDLRQNFQFGCETAWEIKDGKKVRRLKNPTYGGRTTQFWRNLDAVCSDSEYEMQGLAYCGKGRPLQLMAVGHGAAPARFQKVEVGSKNEGLVQYKDGDPIELIDHPEASKVSSKRRGRGRRRRSGGRRE